MQAIISNIKITSCNEFIKSIIPTQYLLSYCFYSFYSHSIVARFETHINRGLKRDIK